MKYRRLGRSGLEVSALALGTVNFGWVAEPREAFLVMDRALERGINLFDTADSYNHARGKDSSESLLGRWLRQVPSRRRQVVVATKVYGALSNRPNDRGLSARHIRDACDASLRRLGTEVIDLYQMHHIDRSTPWDEIWQALEQLVQAGKVLYVGSSNFAAWHMTACHLEGRARHLFGLASEQSTYSLAQRMIELEVLPACRNQGIGLLAHSPLAGGLFSGGGKGARRTQPEIMEMRTRHEAALRRTRALERELGLAEPVAALAWLLHQPGVSAAIVGARTPRQVDEMCTAVDVALSDQTLAAFDRLWPGPGGPAPEAYAW